MDGETTHTRIASYILVAAGGLPFYKPVLPQTLFLVERLIRYLSLG